MPALIDVVLEGVKRVVAWSTRLFMEGVREGYQRLTAELFGTPLPETAGGFVYGAPTNPPWPAIRSSLVGGDSMLIALLVLAICIQARHTLRIFNIGGAYTARRSSQTAWVGAVVIVLWYWIAVTTLYLVDGFTTTLIPDLGAVATTMTGLLAVSLSNPALAFSFAFVGGLAMWVVEALFFIREILLYVYVYGMPIALAVSFGNVPVLSGIARGFTRQFVPLAVMPLPVALLFYGYQLLFGHGALEPSTVFLSYVVAVSLPVVVLYVCWKTFQYGSPVTARVVGGATKSAVLVGGVAAGAAVGGASVGATAARWGPRAAASQALAQHVVTRSPSTNTDGTRSYRRTENEPDSRSGGSPDRVAFDGGRH